MSALSDWLESAILTAIQGGSSVAFSGTYTLHLFTADPGETSTPANECTDTAYTAQPITFSVPAAVTGGYEMSNSGAITFFSGGAATGATITHIGVYDVTNTNWLFMGAVSAKTIGANEALIYAVGDVKLRLV